MTFNTYEVMNNNKTSMKLEKYLRNLYCFQQITVWIKLPGEQALRVQLPTADVFKTWGDPWNRGVKLFLHLLIIQPPQQTSSLKIKS